MYILYMIIWRIQQRMNETLILDILNCINRIIPKRKNQLFFYSVPDYSDNSRALYEYIEKMDRIRVFLLYGQLKMQINIENCYQNALLLNIEL